MRKILTIILLLNLSASLMLAQITIGGSVYGGARQAVVDGAAQVNIHGGKPASETTPASPMIIIQSVYGGNDISGTVTRGSTINTDGQQLFVARLFGGGNGEYDYTSAKLDDGTTDNPYYSKTTPTLTTTVLNIYGGTFGYVFGGGNAATVTGNTTLNINNTAGVINAADYPHDEQLLAWHINPFINDYEANKGKYHINRLFGGNNKTAMAIRPTWNLQAGNIDNLYSGGNAGDMTYPNGIFLHVPSGSNITVNNIYGGCRMADVRPNTTKTKLDEEMLGGYKFPENYAARLLIQGGNIQNVYGGNDVSGNIYFGTDVRIMSSVYGTVYGGGNGAYAYTDNEELKNDPKWGDFYYDPMVAVYDINKDGTKVAIPEEERSAVSLNEYKRPNVENTYMHITGSEAKDTYIGAVYCGGNSATLRSMDGDFTTPHAKLSIGSYVVTDNLFLGSNGEHMKDAESLALYAGTTKKALTDEDGRAILGPDGKLQYEAEEVDFSQIDLTKENVVNRYMRGVAVYIHPDVLFDEGYVPYTAKFGSIYCGGNVGSMKADGCFSIDFNRKMTVYEKLVGGCNNANISGLTNMHDYQGGYTESPDKEGVNVGNKIVLNIDGVKLEPRQVKKVDGKPVWMADGRVELDWHTNGETGDDARLVGGNIYGGCYNSGHINGNVVINLNSTTCFREEVFGDENSGVDIDAQGDDVLGTALNVFGGGYGEDSEIWGSATVNLNKGYTFQVFGGGENGVIGKKDMTEADARYSTIVNLNGAASLPGVEEGSEGDSEDMAECEYLYGGGFEGPIKGNATVNLNNGRIYDSFGGSCNADILGHAETYVGQNGFPYIRDNVYGGNDLGGTIHGEGNFKSRISADVLSMVHNPKQLSTPEVLKASAYVEFVQGRVDSLFGGCYGHYDYKDRMFEKYTDVDGLCRTGFTKPRMNSTFVNFMPNGNTLNTVGKILGASQGYPGEIGRDSMQMRSYVLVNAQQSLETFKDTEVFGSGAYGGIGMGMDDATYQADKEKGSAIIDLVHGKIGAAYGACFKEGITRRTVVNVPKGSTIEIGSIFGGAYGESNDAECDALEANVEYHSGNALLIYNPPHKDDDGVLVGNERLRGAIYGGNNAFRRTIYGKINIDVPVRMQHYRYGMTTGYIYGAGYGPETWSEYTEVELRSGASVYEVYGGGEQGQVRYVEGVLDNVELVRKAEADDRDTKSYTYNTNVIIHQGATVNNYAYGGGLGMDDIAGSGDVYGTTYIALLGGYVKKDIYAAGTVGGVMDKNGAGTFIASTTAYIEGGTVRNVYGGGWKGDVGRHDISTTDTTDDILGESHVIIGIRKDLEALPSDYGFYKGVPAIERNAYSGGEGGAVFGKAYLTLNNGYIGYRHFNSIPEDQKHSIINDPHGGYYQEKIDDETYYVENVYQGDNRLHDCGNVFGGGYDVRSSVDETIVRMYGGTVRNSLHGGAEIATVGRGATTERGEANSIRQLEAIYHPGNTRVEMYSGHVRRNIFGGGKGYNIWGYGQQGTLYTDGYVFGHTEVCIYGGEIGTEEGVSDGYGNVFGGGDIGYVYSGVGTKKNDDDGYYYDDADVLTKDCSVVVEPWCRAKTSMSVNGHNYEAGDYVPTKDLNTLTSISGADGPTWSLLDQTGIVIRNAVFAGGNVSVGSDKVYANTITVYGNVTASICDIENIDLITIGTEHIGGLYGDGNLTFADGYRELCIRNYGTDYYNLKNTISLSEYWDLNDRERAYFQLQYQCTTNYTDTKGKSHKVDDLIDQESYEELSDGDKLNWKLAGVCSIYAGRLMNTLQRADFCGVWGSRMVLQGARDRVLETPDGKDYTINRVGEVSLNQVGDHGNYFGIYNIVNYMGALTSDVAFTSERKTDNKDSQYDPDKDGQSYYEWKESHVDERKRNNGTSQNKVALASGIYLELTEETDRNEIQTEKKYGYITGMVELDLIDVMTGLGGGYVYAKNEHGKATYDASDERVILSENNKGAVTRKYYTYATSDADKLRFETSGNFIHPTKRIVDDCYPTHDLYTGAEPAPAHYWYIHGETYVYEQYITAYTGTSTAYNESQDIPLNITAVSHGKLMLEEVRTHHYAYWGDTNRSTTISKEGIIVNNITYKQGDVINHWQYSLLSESDKKYFTDDDQLYIIVADCTIGGINYAKDYVLLPSDYNSWKAKYETVYDIDKEEDVPFTDVVRPANNLSHDMGYLLTYSVDNPSAWKMDNPTFSTSLSGVYGQNSYEEGDIINEETFQKQVQLGFNRPTSGQAEMEDAYVVTSELTVTVDDNTSVLSPGASVPKSTFDSWDAASKAKAARAYICNSTIDYGNSDSENDETAYYGELYSKTQIDAMATRYSTVKEVTPEQAKVIVNSHFSNAYYCVAAGKYGGTYFSSDSETKYGAQSAWSGLNPEDRHYFKYNYDAFDLLIDPDYSGDCELYDDSGSGGSHAANISKVMPVEYTATFNGSSSRTFTFTDGTTKTIAPGEAINNVEYELLLNEQYYYAPFVVTDLTMYIVKERITTGSKPYSVGNVISKDTYDKLGEAEKAKIDVQTFSESELSTKYYYCREDYGSHRVGERISKADYDLLTNDQKEFTVHGTAPQEITTLYVSRQSDIFDLSKDRVVTVIFTYEYEESDESGNNIELITERHIVNVHLHFESGIPAISTLRTPNTVLPGNTVGLTVPTVTPGLYQIKGGGWEIYRSEKEASDHKNGIEYRNNETPMYWYQNGYYVAYYAKSQLGKTYSNAVPVAVANYHDLSKVLSDDNHLYVDHPEVARDSKIYFHDIDELKTFFGLSHDGTLDPYVKDCQNLQFILNANADRTGSTTPWTPIAPVGPADAGCFEGTLHGDGYTINGLTSSLFGHLCGDVYNLGVTGSFTSAGIADTGQGYVENCWVKSSATSGFPAGVKAVFGNPSRGTGIQVENCYYHESNAYSETPHARGNARKMSDSAFNSGEVAYNLNGFYLKDRYDRNNGEAEDINDPYIRSRYEDGDYRYAGGYVPEDIDERMHTEIEFGENGEVREKSTFTPLWPTDYLYFGQRLNYDYDGAHQSQPSHISSSGNNHVYRAPAYYRSKEMGMVHFNSNAVFAATLKDDASVTVHEGLTAIDFSGYNDTQWRQGLNGKLFYQPLLDDDGLLSFTTHDITRNLLVYVPTEARQQATHDVLSITLSGEPVYQETDYSYRTVEAVSAIGLFGHAVFQQADNSYLATNDHLLVDKHDFNCPITYSFDNDHRMWHQRTPDRYVGASSGWESVSLPFTAELVTTHQKGELTHFYSGSQTADDNGTKIGHEYWLREYRDITGPTAGGVATAVFTYPDAMGTETKTTTNTFLWDYYYQHQGAADVNADTYQQYYTQARSYNGYPYLQATTPYLIGFPGTRYYEFDLSGDFRASNTATPAPEKLERQVITFASKPGEQIGVSDDECTTKSVTFNGFTFRSNFLNSEVPAGGYMLNSSGNRYDKVTSETAPAAKAVYAFRPYFTVTEAAGAPTRGIVFTDELSQLEGDDDQQPDAGQSVGGGLRFSTHRRAIVVSSTLRVEADVQIVNTRGQVVASFNIQPDETIETPVGASGVYIVRADGGHYTKKLALK